MKEFFLFLAITVIFNILTFYFPMLKDNIASLAKSSDVFNFASFIIGFLTLIMTCIADAGIIKSFRNFITNYFVNCNSTSLVFLFYFGNDCVFIFFSNIVIF